MIKLDKYEVAFIKNNQGVLSSLFKKRIDELKEEVIFAPSEEKQKISDLAVELMRWLETVKIFSKKRVKKVKDTGI
jgi:hypothetical protein